MEYIYKKTKNNNYYRIVIYYCTKCNKKLERSPTYLSKNKEILCKICAVKNRFNKIDEEDFKKCRKCSQILSLDKFFISKKSLNYNTVCNKCYNLSRYNINALDYTIILEKQNNVCAICNNIETMKHNNRKDILLLAVDHDHSTGKVRGLLCNSCNRALGLFKESKVFLNKAIEYLSFHNKLNS